MIQHFSSDASLIISAAAKEQFPITGQKEIVMVGKSNVGKSSLINALCNRKRLAYVGQRPGKTRLINFFHIDEDLMLVDVPGYGFANRSKSEQIHYGTLMDSYFELRHPSIMLVMIDIRRGMSEEDEMMMSFAQHYGIAHAVVLSKADKVSRSKAMSMKMQIAKDYDLPVFIFSNVMVDTTEHILNYCKETMKLP